ncbi:hypothetical protein ABZ885_37940, partial [Kitasatospora sp. NPDC047058]
MSGPLSGPGAVPPEDAGTLVGLGRALLDEYDAHSSSARGTLALSRALTAFTTARALLEEACPAAPLQALTEVRFLLGLTLSVRFWQAQDTADYAEDEQIRHAVRAERADAVDLLALSAALLTPGTRERTTAAGRLGLLLHARHEEGHGDGPPDPAARPDDLDRAVEALRTACPAPLPPSPWPVPFEAASGPEPSSGPEQHGDAEQPADAEEPEPGLVATLGCALADRHDRDGSPHDLAAAEAVLEGLLAQLRPPAWCEPGSPPPRPSPDARPGPAELGDPLEHAARERLALLLLGTEQRPATADRTERALAHLELLAATSEPDHPVRLRAALRLVDGYQTRGGGRVTEADAEHHLARLHDIRRLLPPEHPLGGTARWLLGNALAQRAGLERPVVTAAAREAVVVLREGLAGMAADDPVRASSHGLLGTLVNALHEHEPDEYRTEEAVHHLETALESMDGEESNGIIRSDLLGLLAHASIVQDQYGTDRAAIDRVIGMLDESMARPSATKGFDQHAHGALAAAMSRRFVLTNATADLDAAIRHQHAAFRRATPDDVNRVVYLQNLANSLHQRFQIGGDHQDLEASRRYYDEVLAFLASTDHGMTGIHLALRERPALERSRLLLEFHIALNSRDVAGMGRAVALLEPLVAQLPADDPLRLMARGDLGAAAVTLSMFTGDVDRRMRAVAMMAEAAEETPAGHVHKPVLTMRAASALCMLAVMPPFSAYQADGALRYLDDFLGTADPDSMEGIRGQMMRATLLLMRHRHARRAADIEAAVAAARDVRSRLQRGTPTEVLAAVSGLLAEAHRERLGPGDRRRSRETGLAGLRETATAALLQAAADSALTVARDTAARALLIARWCLADHEHGPEEPDGAVVGNPAHGPRQGPGTLQSAVEALELGRGLVLHASTATTDVPDLLRPRGMSSGLDFIVDPAERAHQISRKRASLEFLL